MQHIVVENVEILVDVNAIPHVLVIPIHTKHPSMVAIIRDIVRKTTMKVSLVKLRRVLELPIMVIYIITA